MAGPGPSYLDPGSGGPANDFTNRNTTFMTWNLMHLARMLKHSGGVPAYGNIRAGWDAGCRYYDTAPWCALQSKSPIHHQPSIRNHCRHQHPHCLSRMTQCVRCRI